MTQDEIRKLIAKHGLISDQVDAGELAVILRELAGAVPRVDGDIVEFGCYKGTTSLYIRRVLDTCAADRAFHVYDSFEGLPEKTTEDSSPAGLQFVAGELSASKKGLINEFKKAGLRPPFVHKAWFDDLTGSDVPDHIAFAFLDGDYYDSVRVPLALIEGKLTPSAVIVVDDYANEALPGAAKALDGWLSGRPHSLSVTRSLAVVHLR